MAPSDDSEELEKRKKTQEKLLRGTDKINFDNPIDLTVLDGKVAIVTGGASGIGYGIVQALASHGAKVAVLDLAWNETQEPSDENIKYFKCDVSSWDSQLAAFQQIWAWSGKRVDIAVLSAGVRSHNIKDLILNADAEHEPLKPPSSTFDVNLLGTYYSAYLALWSFTHFRERNGREDREDGWRPQLLFIGSLAGYIEQPLSTDYCSSKHGVRGLWKSVRAHGTVFGDCQINLLAPTLIDNRQGSTKSRGGDGWAASKDVRMGEVADVVAGALRCLCDGRVDGRAVCCVKGEEGYPGSNNFDLCDNVLDLNAGNTLLDSLMDGRVGTLIKQK